MPYPEEKWTPEQRAKKQAQLAQQSTALSNAQVPRGLSMPASPQPSVAPGYSEDPQQRAVQAAADQGAQLKAEQSAQPGVSPGYSSFAPVRDLQHAQDVRAQRGAMAQAGLLPEQQTVNPTANIEPIQLPPQAAPTPEQAAKAQARQATGLLPSLNIMGPAKAAQDARDNQLVPAGGPGPQSRGGARNNPAGAMPAEQPRGLGETLAGAYRVAAPLLNPVGTAANLLTAIPADGLRNAVIRMAGGDPETATGGSTANQDQAYAQLQPYIDGARGLYDKAGGAVSGAILDATGAQRVQPQAVQPQVAASQPSASPDGTVASAQAPASQEAVTAPVPAQAEGQYGLTGIGKGRQGGEIVGRTGADGVREYTNSPEAVAGASGKFGLGRGTFTQGNPGDAAKATAAFERANDEKRKMVASAQQGELGNNGGRVTVVEDSNVGIGIDRERNKNRVYRNRAEEEKANIAKQVTLDTNSRANADSEARGLKTQQELEAGALALDNNRQLESIKAQLANPNLPDAQRKALQETYYILTTAAKDRYMEVKGGTNEFGDKDASKVLDVLNGGYVVDGGAGGIEPGYQEGGYEFLGGDHRDKKNWRKI